MDNNINMIKTKRGLYIPGYGYIDKGKQFQVYKANTRFIYVIVGRNTYLRLARKKDCIIID